MDHRGYEMRLAEMLARIEDHKATIDRLTRERDEARKCLDTTICLLSDDIDKLRANLAGARTGALEEAAKVAEGFFYDQANPILARACAENIRKAIRALPPTDGAGD